MTVSNDKTFKTLRSLLLAATMLASPLMAVAPVPAAAQIAITVQVEPPILPVYDQPPIPEPGYIWTPGYWGYDNDAGYYWVPGTWVQPPEVNLLWTPPYWGWSDGAYLFHDGYWGTHVGFYGGIDYGFGYGGEGYEGGRWEHGNFAYNRVVNNFGEAHITNVYESNVTIVNNNNRVSFNGGTNGVKAQPTAAQVTVEHEHHVAPPPAQIQHVTAAAKNPQLSAKQNGGHPPVAATARPAQFQGPGVVPARPAGTERPPAGGTGAAARPPEHATPTHEPVVPPDARAGAPNRGPAALPPEHTAPGGREPAARPDERAPPNREPTARPPEHTTPAGREPAARPEQPPAPNHEPAARPPEHLAPVIHEPAARPPEHPAPAAHEPTARPPEHPASAPHPAPPPPAAAAHPAPPPHPAEAPHPPAKKDEEKKPPG
ncbi:MAG: hypothetical protein QOJ54_2672 [Aliidongia sp.]|nr:hypothetical protein [Aliidongia sp.]